MQIRRGVSATRQSNTIAIQQLMELLKEDEANDRLFVFLRKAGHRVDGYITQQIGQYPGEQGILLEEAARLQELMW